MSQQQPEISKGKIVFTAILVGIFVAVLILWNSLTFKISSGDAGVMYRLFNGGVDTTLTYGEGFHFKAPWNNAFVYEVRQQEIAEEMQVLSANGLEIRVDVSAWYQPEFRNLGRLHARIGQQYLNRVIVPSLRASARSVIGRYTPDQLYSTKRDIIEDEIQEETKIILAKNYIQLNQVLIRSIILPPTIKQAIESKLKQEQESLEYEFKLEKAGKEAQRQKIDAQGKAHANEILNASLSKNILREKGIQATIELSKSPNTKIVIIGNSEDGLPLILGDI